MNFEYQFRRVLPEAIFVPLDPRHPVFHSFFTMDDINLPHPSVNVTPSFRAVFEDNDPTGRCWRLSSTTVTSPSTREWSGRGRFGMDLTNDAYKLGVNPTTYASVQPGSDRGQTGVRPGSDRAQTGLNPRAEHRNSRRDRWSGTRAHAPCYRSFFTSTFELRPLWSYRSRRAGGRSSGVPSTKPPFD